MNIATWKISDSQLVSKDNVWSAEGADSGRSRHFNRCVASISFSLCGWGTLEHTVHRCTGVLYEQRWAHWPLKTVVSMQPITSVSAGIYVIAAIKQEHKCALLDFYQRERREPCSLLFRPDSDRALPAWLNVLSVKAWLQINRRRQKVSLSSKMDWKGLTRLVETG